eukprot:TRINITY_DN3199_c0_g1_i1.p1 TRINITY_DN3199_c0_g1~~TRINITY_DN3199_c0_g1_i1.p1  ORF type:complete len:317 (-),score=71.27 TRINITY_DN3199_c0_g1_i1:38-988(-)
MCVIAGKSDIVVFQGSFHGRTYGTMSLTTSKALYRTGFGPFLSNIHTIPFPSCSRCPSSGCRGTTGCCGNPVEQLRLLFRQVADPSTVAAVLVEPIQGEGGYIVPPRHFFEEVRAVCTDAGVLLISDEVQTGIGRTGEWLAMPTHFNTVPDIVVMSKGIASGMPLSVVSSSLELMERQPPGSMGGTFAGNAVSCAAANATIEVIESENLLENARQRGKQLREGLERMRTKNPHFAIKEVRGIGLMNAIEFDDAEVPSGFASSVCKHLVHKKLLLFSAGVFEVIRFMPPLVVTAAEIDLALALLEEGLKELLPAKAA